MLFPRVHPSTHATLVIKLGVPYLPMTEFTLIPSRCGGTWNTVRENLDYIQNAGFTASQLFLSSKNSLNPH